MHNKQWQRIPSSLNMLLGGAAIYRCDRAFILAWSSQFAEHLGNAGTTVEERHFSAAQAVENQCGLQPRRGFSRPTEFLTKLFSASGALMNAK
ncbi:MAG TPA: hypothetical protein VNW47_14300 [Terriglobales bacterium]|jgi:hypothetical protein|nr:hypothetical protein [Terriglobales bacterium]